jgi:hypothetical protein
MPSIGESRPAPRARDDVTGGRVPAARPLARATREADPAAYHVNRRSSVHRHRRQDHDAERRGTTAMTWRWWINGEVDRKRNLAAAYRKRHRT